MANPKPPEELKWNWREFLHPDELKRVEEIDRLLKVARDSVDGLIEERRVLYTRGTTRARRAK